MSRPEVDGASIVSAASARLPLPAGGLRLAAIACVLALAIVVSLTTPTSGAQAEGESPPASPDPPAGTPGVTSPDTPPEPPRTEPPPAEEPPQVVVEGSPTVVVPLTESPPAPVDSTASLPAPLESEDLSPEPPLTPGEPVTLLQSPAAGGSSPIALTLLAPADVTEPVLVLDPSGAAQDDGDLVLLNRAPRGVVTTGAVTLFTPRQEESGYTLLVFSPPRRVVFGSDVKSQQPDQFIAQSGWASLPVQGLVIPRATAASTAPVGDEQATPAPASDRPRRPRSRGRTVPTGGSTATDVERGAEAPSPRASEPASPPAGFRPVDESKQTLNREQAEQGAAGAVVRRVRDVVKEVPAAIKWLLAALGAAALAFGTAALVAATRARRAHRRGERLSRDKGILEDAIGSQLPDRTPGLAVSVAFRAAEGPGSGGDFYEVVALDRGRTGFVVGDISGHDRQAVVAATHVRKALRAYLLAGLDPRQVIQVAAHAQIDQLGEQFATVTVAVYEPVERELVYAAAGHPPPLAASGPLPTPKPVCPPIGVVVGAVVPQETVRLEPGKPVLLHTDGLSEARTRKLEMLGHDGLARLLGEMPDAHLLTDRVREIAGPEDDMVACILVPTSDVPATAAAATTPLTVSDV